LIVERPDGQSAILKPTRSNRTCQGTHSRVSEGPKLLHGDAINGGSSKLKVIHEGELTDLSVTLQDQEKIQTYLVRPVKDETRSRGRT
jgi:hypothetical protein